MKVCDILTANPTVVGPDSTIRDAAQRMKQMDVGMLPVCGGDRLVGSVAGRDLAIRPVAQGRSPYSTRVRDIMTPEGFYCLEDDDLDDATRTMEVRQVRRLPVLNRNYRL